MNQSGSVVTDMISFKIRQLVTTYGDSPELANAMRRVLEGERNVMARKPRNANITKIQPATLAMLRALPGG